MAVFSVSFANLICRFGDRLVLLDLADEVVIPALVDDTLVRTSGRETQFFLYETRTDVIHNPADPRGIPFLVVHGRFVKDTVLRRTQVMSDSGLVPDEQAIESAPSAFFVVILNNHKIIYLPETPNAPTLSAFGTTLRRFFKKKHWEYINALYERAKLEGEPKRKKDLLIDIPPPDVEVLPLASRASIEEFLFRFQKLTRFELKILDTNQELQASELYRQIRKVRADLGARKTTVTHESPDGLDKQEAIDQIHAAAATGNQDVRITGKSEDGSTINGNNEHVKLRVPLSGVADDDQSRAAQLIQVYENQVDAGILASDLHTPEETALRRIWDAIVSRRNQ